MPRKTQPKLRLHKATQTAYVELNGHRIYLCKSDHPNRQQKYFSILPSGNEPDAGAATSALDTTFSWREPQPCPNLL